MNLTTRGLLSHAKTLPPAERAKLLRAMTPRMPAPTTSEGVTVSIPIRTVSELNRRDHHQVVAARRKQQRATTIIFVSRHPRVCMPASVRLVRTGGKRLDEGDNLSSALKSIRDGIADVYGVDDGSPLWTWKYDQEIGKGPLGVRVEILPAAPK